MSDLKVVEDFSHIFYILQFFGLTFFLIKKSCFLKLFQKFRCVQLLLIIIVLLFIVIILMIHNVKDIFEGTGNFSKIYIAVGFFQLLGNFAASVTAVYNSYGKSNYERKIFKKIDKIDELLKNEFFIKISSRKNKFIIYTIVQLAFYLMRIIFRFSISLTSFKINFFLLFTFMGLIIKLFVIKYYLFVNILKYRIEKIASAIRSIQDHQYKCTAKKIKAFKEVHILILDIVKLINDCFGIPLLYLFIVSFVALANKIYVIYLSIDNNFQNRFLIGEYSIRSI